MGEATKIEWCDHTFNPWIGCAKVSPGCANCYAAVDTFARTRRANGVELWGKDATRHRTSEDNWRQPLKWAKQAALEGEHRRVFCASQSDVFEDREDLDEWRSDLLELIHRTPTLDWLLLTKRPERWRAVMERVAAIEGDGGDLAQQWLLGAVMPNIWLGTSVEDQQRADERIPHLLSIPATVRFLSAEPLLGPIELRQGCYAMPPDGQVRGTTLDGIDWVIVGGESGRGARPCDIAWIRSIVQQCKAARVPCFVKQLGAVAFGCWDLTQDQHDIETHGRRVHKDPKGGDPSEWPEDLRVREWPKSS